MSSVTRFGGSLVHNLEDSAFVQSVLYRHGREDKRCCICEEMESDSFFKNSSVHSKCLTLTVESLRSLNKRVVILFKGDTDRMNKAFEDAIRAVADHVGSTVYIYCINNGQRRLDKLLKTIGENAILFGYDH